MKQLIILLSLLISAEVIAKGSLCPNGSRDKIVTISGSVADISDMD